MCERYLVGSSCSPACSCMTCSSRENMVAGMTCTPACLPTPQPADLQDGPDVGDEGAGVVLAHRVQLPAAGLPQPAQLQV